jgi:hypothetical protein
MNGAEDPRTGRWLAALRTGSPDEKALARRGLAAIFESRGMTSEAVEMLVANAREGYRDAELFQALARMYRRLGDEYLAASAALEATRLSGHRQPDDSRPTPAPDLGAPVPPPPAPTPDSDAARTPPWHLPLRVAGWITVLATTVAAAAITSQSPLSAALYVLSAAALGLLLLGSAEARRLVRLPDGPLGDSALLFVWLLALLVAGAILPRPLATPGRPTAPAATPGAISTPSPASSGPSAAPLTGSPTTSP